MGAAMLTSHDLWCRAVDELLLLLIIMLLFYITTQTIKTNVH